MSYQGFQQHCMQPPVLHQGRSSEQSPAQIVAGIYSASGFDGNYFLELETAQISYPDAAQEAAQSAAKTHTNRTSTRQHPAGPSRPSCSSQFERELSTSLNQLLGMGCLVGCCSWCCDELCRRAVVNQPCHAHLCSWARHSSQLGIVTWPT